MGPHENFADHLYIVWMELQSVFSATDVASEVRSRGDNVNLCDGILSNCRCNGHMT
jgi:hypothetical protein